MVIRLRAYQPGAFMRTFETIAERDTRGGNTIRDFNFNEKFSDEFGLDFLLARERRGGLVPELQAIKGVKGLSLTNFEIDKQITSSYSSINSM